jgi:competence protein ComEC
VIDRFKLGAGLVIFASVGIFGSQAIPWSHVNSLSFLSVGQGDATLVRSEGKAILIDGGPATPSFDAGARLVVPWLKRTGVRQIDLFVVTHPDQDHVGGLPGIARQIPIREIVIRDDFRSHPVWQAVSSEPALRGVPITYLKQGRTRKIGEANLTFWVLPALGTKDDNDLSLVTLIEIAGSRALLTGDLPSTGEQALIRKGLPPASLLKLGHHGSSTSTSVELLEVIQPETAIASVGATNNYGHPAWQTLQRLRRAGIRLKRTDRDGTLTFVPNYGRWTLSR